MDASEYKHVILGLIFLKYISDSFESRRQWLVKESADPKSEYFVKNDAQRAKVAEDRDEYAAENVFCVPPKARWTALQNNAKQPTIGKLVDDAMDLIERENPSLKGILPKNYARPDLDKTRLGEVIDLIGTISVGDETLKAIARDLVKAVRKSVTIDWTMKESVRAKIRTLVKRILRRHDYPPDKQEKATQTVLQQAELLCGDWADGEAA